jgi:hypothetical protein
MIGMSGMRRIHEQHGRLIKAIQLADVLDALHITSAAASILPEASWASFALIAQVPTPTAETQKLTGQLLTDRENMREWVARSVVTGLVAHKCAA